MTYNFDKIQEDDFCCIYCFIDQMLEEVEDLDKHDSIVTVANDELAHEIFRILSEARCECGERLFHFGFVEFNDYEYEGEYIITVSSDHSISLEPMITENGDYLYGEGKIIFIHSDCNYKAIERYEGSNIVIFGIEDEDE